MPMAFYPGASSRSWAELSRAELAKIASRYSLSESLTHFTAFTLRAKPGSGLRAALRQCGRAGPPAQAPPGNPPAVSAAAVAGHCCPGAATGTQLGHLGILGG